MPESALSKTLCTTGGRGRCSTLPNIDDEISTVPVPTVPMPSFLFNRLSAGGVDIEEDDFMKLLKDEELTSFYLTYVHTLTSDILRIYQTTTSQNNDAWLAEREVCTSNVLVGTTHHVYCST